MQLIKNYRLAFEKYPYEMDFDQEIYMENKYVCDYLASYLCFIKQGKKEKQEIENILRTICNFEKSICKHSTTSFQYKTLIDKTLKKFKDEEERLQEYQKEIDYLNNFQK